LLSSSFEIAADGTRFTITNIYAPCDRERYVNFLTELQSLSDLDSDPWLLVGDFNIARYTEKTGTMTTSTGEPRAI
jgi:exonuclease III